MSIWSHIHKMTKIKWDWYTLQPDVILYFITLFQINFLKQAQQFVECCLYNYMHENLAQTHPINYYLT